MEKLKPCPFCGNPPKLFGKKIREIDGETMKVYPERTEWKIVPFCQITCLLGQVFSSAYGLHGGDGGYKTPEAAINAWNKRYEEGRQSEWTEKA